MKGDAYVLTCTSSKRQKKENQRTLSMVLSVLIFVSVEIDLDINARRNLVMKSVKSLCSFYFLIVSFLIIFP